MVEVMGHTFGVADPVDMEAEKWRKLNEKQKAYDGQLEKLKKKKAEMEHTRAIKIEEQQAMIARQAEKEKLKAEIKNLNPNAGRVKKTAKNVIDIGRRSWAITKNVGHGMSVAGGSIMGALGGGNLSQPARNVPVRQTASPKRVLQQPAQPQQPAFNLESFENQIIGGGGGFGMGTPTQQMTPRTPRTRARTAYRKVKERIKVKRGRKWVSKTVTRRMKVHHRLPRIRRMARIPRAPVQKAFDINDVLKGMPS